MIDKQLEEQLERIRSLNEQLSAMHRGVTENSRLIGRERPARHEPLSDVRDDRTHQSPDYDDFPPQQRADVRPFRFAADRPRRRRRR